MRRMDTLAVACIVVGAVISFGCGGSQPVPAGSEQDDGGAGGAGFSLGDPGAPGANTGVPGTLGGAAGTGKGGTTGGKGFACTPGATQCSDGKDNDGDGKIDGADPECIGPCDDDEGSFATGIPGDNMDACKQDCFFDGNSGMGDDGCQWNLKCDPANPGGTAAKACPYDPKYKNCPKAQSQQCLNNCRRLTPNGCDCFGCCSVPVNGQTIGVRLVESCTADQFGNATKCPRCTPQAACINPCDKCEVCVGKPAPDPSCSAGPVTPPPVVDSGASPPPPGMDAGTPPPPSQCAPGATSCGPNGQVPVNGCGGGYYCLTGCCVRYIL
jgi:hypothetical protein